jgi:PAS domain-containing protein
MNKSFRINLKKIILFGTIIPTVCFLLMFVYKFLNINIDAEKTLFEQDYNNLEAHVTQLLENKQGLLNTSYIFLTNDDLLGNDKIREEYLDRLYKNSDVVSYSFVTDDINLENSGVNIKQIKSIEVINDELHIGNGTLTLAFDLKEFESDISRYLDKQYTYTITYKNNILIDDINKSYDTAEIKWRFVDKEMIYSHAKGNITIVLRQDIAREIKSLYKTGVFFLMLFIVFVLFMTQVVFFSSKALLRPLNILIDSVSKIADDHVKLKEINIVDDEYYEIYCSFDKMVKSVNNNIENIKVQSIDINDKNYNMVDMNEQLEESLINLESTTKQLEILEKQSRILVDHIKDLMWVIDSKGRIQYINNVVYEKLGYEIDDLLGVKIEHILQRDFKNEEAYQEIFFSDFDEIELKFITNNKEHEEIFSCSTKR